MVASESATTAYLTEEAFWRNYWANLQLPKLADEGFSYDRCLMRTFRKFVPSGQGRRLLEVGCAPGRWMIWFHRSLGYDVEGVEYVDVACEKTRENLAMNHVPTRVYQADFLNWSPPEGPYDAVLSIGFIEHFVDVHAVIQRHIDLLKPGGTLILLVPNFRGINFALQWFLNRDWLRVHNTKIMTRGFFQGLSKQYPITPRYIGYVGGIEPVLIALPGAGGVGTTWGKFLPRLVRRLFLTSTGITITLLHKLHNRLVCADYLNHPWFSSTLVGVFSRD